MPKRPYSISLQAMWTSLPFAERVRKAGEAGFDLVDLWDWKAVDIDEIARIAADHGMRINGFFGNRAHPICAPGGHALVVDEIKRSIDCASRVNAGQIAIFSNAISEGMALPLPPHGTAALDAAAVEALREVADTAQSAGVTLILEHLNDVFLPSYYWIGAPKVTSLCREVDHPAVRMAFDCFHQQLSGGRLTDNLVACLPYMARFDVAEVPGRHEPGHGEINFRHLLRVLDQHEWEGPITFEVNPHDGVEATALAAIDREFPR
ncbi:MAG: hypothetical protein DCC69_05495 [Hyphomicrobiales bacterium]|nr:MAG: hypothetical protein DCC69_05495 [Hyphomicrobiales bacterium]